MALILMVLGAVFIGTPVSGQEYSEVLDGTEQQAMTETLQYALEYNKNGEESFWANPETGRSGSVVPVNRFVDATGLTCREYISTFSFDGDEGREYGTACRKDDGGWMVVLDQGATGYAELVTGPSYVYVYRDPHRYYYPWVYYAPYYYPHRIYFSFVFSSHSGYFHYKHFHHGHRYYKGKSVAYKKGSTYGGRYYHGKRYVSHKKHHHGRIHSRHGPASHKKIKSHRAGYSRYDHGSGYRHKVHGKRKTYDDPRIFERRNATGVPDRKGGHHFRKARHHQGQPGRKDIRGFKGRKGRHDAGIRTKIPDVRNIHRNQGVDVWAPIRSDWGYKGNRGYHRGGFGRHGGSSGFHRGSGRGRR